MLNLVSQIEKHALNQPTKTCLSFVTSKEEIHIDYLQLHQTAKRIAAYLVKRLAPQDRVLLIFPSNIEFIYAWLGCVYAGMIAVPIMPPNNDNLMDKTINIIKNATPNLVLLSQHIQKQEQQLFGGIEAVYLAEIDQYDDFSPNICLDNTAFLQYTSGSTGNPKGVMIDHHNLTHNLTVINQAMNMQDNPVHCSWLPPHHDMGLIGFILASLFGGHQSIIMPPFSFLQNPLFWLQTITKYKANLSGGPNFAFDYCVNRIKDHKKQGLDLSSWRVAPNGAEPVKKETMLRFYDAFKDYGFSFEAFRPCYGLAEATLLVSNRKEHDAIKFVDVDKHQLQQNTINLASESTKDTASLVGSGRLFQQVAIVNPETLELCSDMEVGEIWIASPSVSQGYWHNLEATGLSFKARYKNQSDKTNYLRSGDLGFLFNQELFITGRIKDLIILSGKNHYPQDIETSIMNAGITGEIGRVAAYSICWEERERLGIMIEVKNQFGDNDVYEKMALALRKIITSEHHVEIEDIAFIPFKKLQHTTSGKIRRQVCRQKLIDDDMPIVYRWQKQSIEEVVDV